MAGQDIPRLHPLVQYIRDILHERRVLSGYICRDRRVPRRNGSRLARSDFIRPRLCCRSDCLGAHV